MSVALLAGLSAQAQKTNAAPVKEKKNVGTVLSNIWKKTRDPKLSDDEFEESIRERIDRLEENY